MSRASVCVCAVVLLTVCAATGADPGGDDEPTGGQAAWIGVIHVRGDIIDIDVKNATLGDVFQEIGRQAAIELEAPASVAGQLVAERFTDLHVIQGIQRLLAGHDHMIHRAPLQSAQRPGALIVRVLGESSPENRLAGRSTTSTLEPDEAAWQRAHRLSELADDADSATIIPAIEPAIRDPHPIVRETALHLVEMLQEEEAPASLVAEIALHDADPDLRIAALDILDNLSEAHREVAVATFKAALNDPNSEVKELAQDLMDGLDAEN